MWPSSPPCAKTTMRQLALWRSSGLRSIMLLLLLLETSGKWRVTATADYYYYSDQRDHGYYVVGEGQQQQQLGGPVASRFPNFYREASDLLYDLSKFDRLYVQYHSCQ
jgi:hypothetical protein